MMVTLNFLISSMTIAKKNEGRVMDMMLRKRQHQMSLKEIKKEFPFVDAITFEDCYDLSVNIFTADQVTLMRMIDI